MRMFEEHHGWKVITLFFGSLACFPSKLGMYDGNLTRIVGQKGSCWMGSLINLEKNAKSKVAKNGICQLGCG